MNLPDIIEFLLNEKNKVADELISDELSFDDETVVNVELSFGDIDQIVEILSSFNDATEDEDWEDDEDE